MASATCTPNFLSPRSSLLKHSHQTHSSTSLLINGRIQLVFVVRSIDRTVRLSHTHKQQLIPVGTSGLQTPTPQFLSPGPIHLQLGNRLENSAPGRLHRDVIGSPYTLRLAIRFTPRHTHQSLYPTVSFAHELKRDPNILSLVFNLRLVRKLFTPD